MAVEQFDLISGLAGMGAYLLCRRADAGPAAALREVLALARRGGVEVAGLAEAIRSASDWLLAGSVEDAWGVNWPAAVPVRPAGAAAGPASEPAHAAWCYGAPGVARALFLAGEALADAALRDRATRAMLAVVARPASARRIGSATFCHGLAGLLQITLRFARDTGLAVFEAEAGRLAGQIVAAADPGARLRILNAEPDGRQDAHPGLLDGAPGTALALLARELPEEPAWDRLFLLS